MDVFHVLAVVIALLTGEPAITYRVVQDFPTLASCQMFLDEHGDEIIGIVSDLVEDYLDVPEGDPYEVRLSCQLEGP